MPVGSRALVVGGGPAGAAAAIHLGRAGHDVTILERGGTERMSMGETLPPPAAESLRALGVWERFRSDGHRPARRTGVAWGESDLVFRHHLFNPYGHGWHIERRRFDAMLLDAAEAAGARRQGGARVACVERAGDRWSVHMLLHGRRVVDACDWLIDATGRGASLSRLIGEPWIDVDRLVARFGRFSPAAPVVPEEDVLLVESAELGWWYSAMLPDGALIAAYVTDRDGSAQHGWPTALASTLHTADRVRAFGLTEVCACSASVGHVARAGGAGWVAVGDASLAHDPLSGQGLVHALLTGIRGAEGLCRGEIETYVAARARDREAYLRVRTEVYRRETRWPSSPFWSRRQTRTPTEPKSGG
jgi:2-polyprenyl-6-methoxyphenol hydroxylase-like FAD-dependent oxidoreductase